MIRALATFSVAHGGVRLRVRLLPTVAAVDAQYRDGRRRRAGQVVHAYFQPSASAAARHHGTIVLGMDGQLDELVPHEVTHAVIHYLRGVSANDDELAATAVGILSARIFSRTRSMRRDA
jgi:hypothetical protein